MKRRIHAIVISMVLFLSVPQTALAAQLLIPGGQLVGIELQNDTVTVAAFDDACGAAAREAGLQIGDQILSVDGQRVSSAEDVRQKWCPMRDFSLPTITAAMAISRSSAQWSMTTSRMDIGRCHAVKSFLARD